jgi:hypothetical protein
VPLRAKLGALTIVASLALGAGAAQAGTYTTYSCELPGGDPATMDGWHFTLHDGSVGHYRNACPSGPFSMWMDPGKAHDQGDYVNALFTAPADTTIAAYTLWRSVQVALNSPHYYSQREGRSGTFDLYDHCWGDEDCSALGDPDQPFGAGNRYSRSAPDAGLTQLKVYVGCQDDTGQNRCPSQTSMPVDVALQLHRVDLTLRDDYSPVFAAPPSGPLVTGGGPLAGVQPVSIAATDRGGGVYQGAIEVDGNVVTRQTLDTNNGRCAPPYGTPAPCPLSASGTLALDTTGLADGAHQVRLLVSDVAGNTAVWGPLTITTANAACNLSPTGTGATLAASFPARHKHGKRRHKITARYGRGVRVDGTLSASDGHPLAGADVCVLTEPDGPGDALQGAGSLTTNGNGQFTTMLPSGPSRTIWFVHRTGDGAVSARLHVATRPQVHLRPARRHLRNGQRLILRGRVPGPIPAGGVIVQLKTWRAEKHSWQVFSNPHTRSDGRFTGTYWFTRVPPGTFRYRIKAVVPTQSSYPYAVGWSRVVAVRVRG